MPHTPCQRPPHWRHSTIGIKAPRQDQRNAPLVDRHIGAGVGCAGLELWVGRLFQEGISSCSG